MLRKEHDCSTERGERYLPFGGNSRRTAWVEWRCGLEDSGGPDFGEPGNQLLASVSGYLPIVYLDSALSVVVVRDS